MIPEPIICQFCQKQCDKCTSHMYCKHCEIIFSLNKDGSPQIIYFKLMHVASPYEAIILDYLYKTTTIHLNDYQNSTDNKKSPKINMLPDITPQTAIEVADRIMNLLAFS